MSESALVTHSGGCHCGRVRYTVQAPAELRVVQCNCSICSKAGFLHLMVPAAQFKLLSGTEVLHDYQFNTGTAHHLFCTVCGVKSYYVPRSHPDGYSVNVRCLDEGSVTALHVSEVDGRNWEQQYPQGRGQYEQ